MRNNTVYLTFDMDWACDEILRSFTDLMRKTGVSYTFNVTHQTTLLDELRRDSRIELGIHPNFNNLLSRNGSGIPNEKTFVDVIKEIKPIVPEAVTARSHSLTDSTPISIKLSESGIRYSLNILIPPCVGNRISAFRDPSGIIKIPFCYEDDIWFGYYYDSRVPDFFDDRLDMPLIFNFHPIHIYLNSDSKETYEAARPYSSIAVKDHSDLSRFINNDNYGARNWLLDLIDFGMKNGYDFKTIKEGCWV